MGCRLKIITSSSIKCRSTLYPYCRWRSLGFGWYRRSTRSPLSRMIYLAPGYWLCPLATSVCILQQDITSCYTCFHIPVNVEGGYNFWKSQILGNGSWHSYLINTQIRVRSDDSTCREINSFSHKIATYPSFLAL